MTAPITSYCLSKTGHWYFQYSIKIELEQKFPAHKKALFKKIEESFFIDVCQPG
jgi:hypothetical protein